MPKFQIGDIVELLSGGPPMTVRQQIGINGLESYRCVWFDTGGQLHEREFEVVLLKAVSA